MAVVGTPGYRNVRKGESGSCGAVRPALEHVGSHCPSFVVQPRTVDVLEAPTRLAFAQHPTAFPPPPIGDPPCPKHQQSRS